MSKPKILHAINELDENGFYDKSKHLGDIRTTATCLDSVKENGIYVFTGGTSSPTDTTGSYKWVLEVHACENCTYVVQEATRLNCSNYNIKFTRYCNNGTWGSFIDSDRIFIATVNTTKYSEVTEALNANKFVVAKSGSGESTTYYDFTHKDTVQLPYRYVFQYYDALQGRFCIHSLYSDDSWGYGNHYIMRTSGGTMTGNLTLKGDPTADLHAATKQYVDNAIGLAIGGSY